MSILGLFGQKKSDLRVVVDVGSHSIKTVIFESPETRGSGIAHPRALKKKVVVLPVPPDPVRIVSQLRETLFSTVKDLGRIPSVITVALGPYLAEHSLAVWNVDKGLEKRKAITRKELGSYFQNLFEGRRDPKKALIAYPLDLLVNGYGLGSFSKREDKITLGGAVSFRTFLLYFPHEIGAALSAAKQSLGGLPIEFLPLSSVYQESIPRALGISDAFLIDVGGEETTLCLLKEGTIAHVASFALGAHHFLRGIARVTSVSLDEAEDLKRQYTQGAMSEAKKQELNNFIRQEVLSWKKMFLASLESFYPVGPLPARVLFFGGGAYITDIADDIKNGEWMRDFSYATSPEVQILRAENFFQGDTFGGLLSGPEDAGLASLVVYSMYHRPLFG